MSRFAGTSLIVVTIVGPGIPEETWTDLDELIVGKTMEDHAFLYSFMALIESWVNGYRLSRQKYKASKFYEVLILPSASHFFLFQSYFIHLYTG